MSELAGQHYQERADQLGIAELPPILNGYPLGITSETQPISVHSQEGKLLNEARETLQESLESTHQLVLASVPGLTPKERESNELHDFGHKNAAFLKGFLSNLLLPDNRLTTGRLVGLSLEAITLEEADEAALEAVQHTRHYQVDPTNPGNVYLQLSGTYKGGDHKHALGSLVVVHASSYHGEFRGKAAQSANNVTFVRYSGQPHGDTKETFRKLLKAYSGSSLSSGGTRAQPKRSGRPYSNNR